MNPSPGQLIGGKYRLLRRLAEGGMAAVWLADDEILGRSVAIKFSHDAGASRSSERLEIEARAAASLSHPHVVRVYDFGRDGERPFLVMEYLEGEDLAAMLERVTRLPLTKALIWIRQVAEGLRAVHDAGYIHRDVKPKNVFVESRGETLKLLDFGIVRTSARGTSDLTEEGLVLGSAPYMSPEQARGQPLRPASDPWSLAAVFYRMLTGVSAFEATHSTDALIRVCTERPTAPSKLVPSLPSSVDEFFERAFAIPVELRAQNVDEFLADLASLSDASPPRGRPGRETETEALPIVTTAPSGSAPKRRSSQAVWLLVLAGAALALFLVLARRSTSRTMPKSDLAGAKVAERSPGSLPVPSAFVPPSSEDPPGVLDAAPPSPAVSGPVRRDPIPAGRAEAPAPSASVDPIFGLPVSSP